MNDNKQHAHFSMAGLHAHFSIAGYAHVFFMSAVLLKCSCQVFYSYLNEMKKSTVSSYNLISNHFNEKLKGKQL